MPTMPNLTPQLAVIFLIAAAIFLISFIRTDFALIILIFSMLLSPELELGGIPGRAVVLRADDLFLLVVFFGWLAKMAVYKELTLFKYTSLNRPIFIYILICLIATILGAMDRNLQIKHSIFYLLKYTEYFLLFFVVINNIKNLKQIKIFIFFLLLTCFLVTLYGWMHMGSEGRLSAPFEGKEGEANTFGGYLVLMMALILGLAIYTQSTKQRFILLSLLAFVVPPFLFTLSRGSWLAFFAMYITLIIISKRAKITLIFGLLFVVISAILFSPGAVRERVAETFRSGLEYKIGQRRVLLDESTSARIQNWRETFIRLKKRPLLGYGIPEALVVDNQYTRVLRETGLVGFLVFIWLIARVYKVGKRAYALTQDDTFSQGVSLGFLAGLAGLLLHALGTATFILIRIMEPFWFLVAIIVMLPEILFSAEK